MAGIRDIPSSNKGNRGISSSYPPTNPRSRETLHRTQGWEPNPFGDYPENPMSSSMCFPSTPGYDATRSVRCPDGTRMAREHDDYKAISARAAAASTRYNTERRERGSHIGKISGEGHEQLYAQSQTIIGHRTNESNARDGYLYQHLGRRDHKFYGGHKQQVEQQNEAVEKMKKKSWQHKKALGR